MRAEIEIQWCVLLAHIPEIFKEVENQIEGHLLRLEAYIKGEIDEWALIFKLADMLNHPSQTFQKARLRYQATEKIPMTSGENGKLISGMGRGLLLFNNEVLILLVANLYRSALKRTIYTGEDTVIMQEMTPIYQSLASIEGNIYAIFKSG